MPEYENLASLRSDLNSDDRGRMLDAADSVRDAGLSVDDVLGNDPPLQKLREAGLIPEEPERGPPASDLRQQMVQELKDIKAALEGGN